MDPIMLLFSAAIMFTFLFMVITAIPELVMQSLLGYLLLFDGVLHGTTIFLGAHANSVVLIGSELAAIALSIYLRGYRRCYGTRRIRYRPQPRYGFFRVFNAFNWINLSSYRWVPDKVAAARAAKLMAT